MHLSFESLAKIGALGLQAFLMHIHHNTSLNSIMEDDSISWASRTRIYFCSSKGARLWLVSKPSIGSFHITHFIFTSALHFHLNLIQPSASNLLMCECGHGLDTFGKHLICCPFRGQRIATHDTIRNVTYSLIKRMSTLYGESCGTPLH
jgi:hypothetical protein